MPEEFHLCGGKQKINDPLQDGLQQVRVVYPDAVAEGSVGHYTYSLGTSARDEQIVAEAWTAGRVAMWILCIKPKL